MKTLKNALQEWLDPELVRCAYIKTTRIPMFDEEPEVNAISLPEGYDEDQFKFFLAWLDSQGYDNWEISVRTQGYVWMKDGSWVEQEMDGDSGNHWWVRRRVPRIPSHLVE